MVNKKNKKKQGFTLVEMVIVITILGILSGIGFMKFGEVQQNAKVNADKVAASSLVTATNLAIQGGKISVDKEKDTTIAVTQLKTHGYISTIPKPQSEDGNFDILVSKSGDVFVNINSTLFYPKDDTNTNEG